MSAATAGDTNTHVAAAKAAATMARRTRVGANPEKNLFDVSTLISLAFYWQLLGIGGSTRTYVMGPVAFTPQDERAVSYCRRLVKDDGAIDFAAPAAVLAARINGLFPWPACSIEVGGQPVKLGLADALDGGGAPGEVVGADASGLLVGTGAGVLRLRRLQRPGGKMLEAAEFLRGFAVAPGTRVASRPMPPLVSPAPFPR